MVKSLEPLIGACAFVLLAACSNIAPEPSPDRLRLAGTTNGGSPVKLVKSANAQELPVLAMCSGATSSEHGMRHNRSRYRRGMVLSIFIRGGSAFQLKRS
jgi:hypothetical protein